MKIGLLTYHHSTSYGAMMQTYATCRVLKQLGHEVKIVDIRQSEKHRKGFLKILLGLFYIKRNKQINDFKKKFYAPLTRRYMTMDELRRNPPDVDCLVVGSDQTWNPNISKDKAMSYFLDFGGDNIRRISYASSFGMSGWKESDSLTQNARRCLSRFKCLSVREKTGKQILKDTFGLNSNIVLDPTLLFDSYNEITSDIPQREELVCYKLVRNKDFYDNISKIKDRLGIPARLLVNAYPVRGLKYTYPPSIKEWLQRIGGARFVITDSFHGLAFCLIFQRQFAVIKLHNGLDSRFVDLMTEIGLEERLFDSMEEMCHSNIWEKPIDYNMVVKRLEKMKEVSLEFLNSSLK